MAYSDANRRHFRRALLSWYDASARDLPWRHTRDPYSIWISEVMLQQTRVAVVIDRYTRFLQRFPSIRDLARSRESTVLAEWSGLGYYRRARNLRAAARVIVEVHKGEFPQPAAALRKLPGIGRYTAAAIASIAFGEQIAVVDGNVKRVLSRLHGRNLPSEKYWSAAQELVDDRRPGDFNQAMMELGAIICLPAQPNCTMCPIRKFCRTRGGGPGQKRKPPQRRREVAYLLSRRSKSVLLVRRAADHRLMPDMWELPGFRLARDVRAPALFSLRHSITQTNYRVHVFAEVPTAQPTPVEDGRWVNVARIDQLPLTGLARKILRRANII